MKLSNSKGALPCHQHKSRLLPTPLAALLSSGQFSSECRQSSWRSSSTGRWGCPQQFSVFWADKGRLLAAARNSPVLTYRTLGLSSFVSYSLEGKPLETLLWSLCHMCKSLIRQNSHKKVFFLPFLCVQPAPLSAGERKVGNWLKKIEEIPFYSL